MMRATIALAVAAFAAGCALKDNVEPPRDLQSFPATLDVTRVWTASVAGAGDVRVGLRPAVGDGHAYVAGRDGVVHAFDLTTGRSAWRTDVGTPLAGGPAYGDALVVVGASDGTVAALDASDGTVRWTAHVASEVLSPAAVADGIVVVRTGDGRLHGLDGADGGSLWRYEQSVPLLSVRGVAAPVIAEGIVVAGFDNGRVTANRARDGQLMWDIAVGVPTGRTELERVADVNAPPRVIGRDVYVVSTNGRIAALGLESGRALWAHEISSTAGLGAAALGVWVTDEDSEVVGYDRLSGSLMWRQDALRARALTAPAPVGDAVAVGDLDGFVHFLSQETGELVARVRAGRGPVWAAPVVAGNIVIVQTAAGAVSAYRVAD